MLTTGTVSATSVNLRAKADLSAKIVDVLIRGAKVEYSGSAAAPFVQVTVNSEPDPEIGYIDQTQVSWDGAASLPPDGGQNNADDKNVLNAYPTLNTIPYAKTILPMADFISYLKQHTDISFEVKCAVYTIWIIESAYGKAGINNNYCGFQADGSSWAPQFGPIISATCVKVDRGGVLRRFVCFLNWSDCIIMLQKIIVNRGLYVGGKTNDKITNMVIDSPAKWVLAYYREWVTGNGAAIPSSQIVQSVAACYQEAESAIGAASTSTPPLQPPPADEDRVNSGDRNKLINIAKSQGDLHLVWNSAADPAEKFLAELRPAMQELGQIGPQPVYYEWCGAFVTWCCRQAGYQIPDEPRGEKVTMALVDAWRDWGIQTGTLLDVPRTGFNFEPGDILLFQWYHLPANLNHTLDHIGICVSIDGAGNVVSAEGNTDHPGQTDVKKRNLANIAGVIRMPQ